MTARPNYWHCHPKSNPQEWLNTIASVKDSSMLTANMCFCCRCFVAFLRPWWGTCPSWSSTSPNQVWPRLTWAVLRKSCAKSEASWSSFLWTSCLSRTSCLPLERRRAWSQRRFGHKGRVTTASHLHIWIELFLEWSIWTVVVIKCVILDLQEIAFNPEVRSSLLWIYMTAGHWQISTACFFWKTLNNSYSLLG